jgi:peptide/nickel transport system permease protein
VLIQYGRFLDRLVLQQSLGRSFTNRQDVTHEVLQAAPVTASLVFGGAVLWLMVSIPIGILSALRPRSLLDRVTMCGVLIGISAHPVWIGLLAAYFGGFRLHLFPITGYSVMYARINFMSSSVSMALTRMCLTIVPIIRGANLWGAW